MRGQQAQAVMQGSPQCPGVRGLIRFTAQGAGTIVEVHVCGLPGSRGCATRLFGLEIHECGDCTPCRGRDPFCNTGGPFRPCRCDRDQADGDLLPLLATDGEAIMTFFTGAFSVRDIIGRSVVVLMDPDDPHCGGQSIKIACGVICPVRPDCDREPCRPEPCRPEPCRPEPCPPRPCPPPPCPPRPCPPRPPCRPEPCSRWADPCRIIRPPRCPEPPPHWPWR